MEQTRIVSLSRFEELLNSTADPDQPDDLFPYSTPNVKNYLLPARFPHDQWSLPSPLPRIEAEEFRWRFQGASFFDQVDRLGVERLAGRQNHPQVASAPADLGTRALPPEQLKVSAWNVDSGQGLDFSWVIPTKPSETAVDLLKEETPEVFQPFNDDHMNSQINLDENTLPKDSLVKKEPFVRNVPSLNTISVTLKKERRVRVNQDLACYTKIIEPKNKPGKKPKLKTKWTLICAHCKEIFHARPTPKNSRYVVNHICANDFKKRKQFVIGTRSRKCKKDHKGPCMTQLKVRALEETVR